VFSAVEINSSFYKPHRASTFACWAASVPAEFRFSVKLAKAITHEKRLVGTAGDLDEFLRRVEPLGDKLACLLVQLPPSLSFDAPLVRQFFISLRQRLDRDIALEARNATWFTPSADRMLVKYRIARVAADPACVPDAASPGGWSGVAYYRWHGSPRMYYSSYDAAALGALAARINEARRSAGAAWCIFDNTASGAATSNALGLRALLAGSSADGD
jgi:uncharacterized protein YecE (DUF72 family)